MKPIIGTGDPQPPMPEDYQRIGAAYQRAALHWQLMAVPDEAIEEAYKRLLEIYKHHK